VLCAPQAAELGQWGLARAAFEGGLRGSPRRTLMAERLVEVLLQLGDYHAAAAAAARLLRLDRCHPRALRLAAALAARGVELPAAARRCLPGAPTLSRTLCLRPGRPASDRHADSASAGKHTSASSASSAS